jgi:hypothetical protein
MKNFLRFYLVFSLIVVSFSCSDDDSDDNDIGNFNITNYEIIPNTANSLVSKVFVENDQATSYFYGDSDSNGTLISISGLAYQQTNSNQITYFTLDDQGRLSYMYNEVNGIKDSQIINFTYPEDNLVNFIFLDRNWDTGIDSLIEFVPVEIDGDNFTAIPLLNRQTNDSALYQFLANHIGVIAGAAAVVAVAAVGVTVGGVALGVLGGLAVSTALLAEENNGSDTPFVPEDPESPEAPEEVNVNQCEDTNLEVIIGVDPGNLIVAIVNGESVDYDFYWSTGETSTELISDSIVAPEDGNYYVLVIDDNGCLAFGSATIGTMEIDPNLLLATWYLVGETENGNNTFDVNACNITVEFTDTQLIATEFFGDDCEFSDEIPSNYEVNGNIITETADGDTSFITILELTPFKMVLQEVDGDFTYVETYTNIFGGWSFAENSNCVVSNGDTFTDNGSGELLTLNNDYTVVLPDDSNGNYLTNGFTFENYILTINLSYQDFFSPACEGVNFQTATNAMTLTYDPVSNSFSGTSQSSRNDVIGSDCSRLGETCTGTVSMTR